MIELRWFCYKATKKLQYRTYSPPPMIFGPITPPYPTGWSEWKDVPEVDLDDIEESDDAI